MNYAATRSQAEFVSHSHNSRLDLVAVAIVIAVVVVLFVGPYRLHDAVTIIGLVVVVVVVVVGVVPVAEFCMTHHAA